jgi:hypothetical protein
MASFNYDAYAAQQEARKSNNLTDVQFLNEYLKNDGDVVVVRFPYQSMADLVFETTHAVTFPGKRFPSRVRCTGDASCPFCAQGVKLDIRFFAKLLAYVVDEASGQVNLINTVWDRPSAFADIDIKNLMQEYGDISKLLFKIKRNGTGTSTRYTITPVLNATVYNPAIYKADFTELNKVDPVKILSKSIEQYNEAVNPGTAPKQAANKPQPQQQTNFQAPPTQKYFGDEYSTQRQPSVTDSSTPTVEYNQTVPGQVTDKVPTEQRRQPTRYEF